MSAFNQRRNRFNPSQIIIAGDIQKDIRYKASVGKTGEFILSSGDAYVDSGVYLGIDGLPSGTTGYSSALFPTGDIPSNLNDSGFYEIRSSTVGMFTAEHFEEVLSNSIDYENKDLQYNFAAVSLDGLFVPYTTAASGNGLLPHFVYPASTSDGDIDSRTLNPFGFLNNLPTDTGVMATGVAGSGYPTGIEGYWLKYGHNIATALHGDIYDDSFDDYNFDSNYTFRGAVETNGIRSIALRGPLVLSGPGFDLQGNPVPRNDANDAFHPEAYWNQSLWKTGPVDLRWSEDRGVWTINGGGGEVIKFTVTGAADSIGNNATGCDHVIATVTGIGCSTTQASVGDSGVKIYDDDMGYFNVPLSLLIGLKGTAQRFTNPFAGESEDTDCISEAAAEGSCRWVVTGLLCGEEIE